MCVHVSMYMCVYLDAFVDVELRVQGCLNLFFKPSQSYHYIKHRSFMLDYNLLVPIINKMYTL